MAEENLIKHSIEAKEKPTAGKLCPIEVKHCPTRPIRFDVDGAYK
jgi:hypothetical protein